MSQIVVKSPLVRYFMRLKDKGEAPMEAFKQCLLAIFGDKDIELTLKKGMPGVVAEARTLYWVSLLHHLPMHCHSN